MSTRSVSRHLSVTEEKICPSSVSRWYRLAAFLFDQFRSVKRRKVIVDETSIHIQVNKKTLVEMFLWVAVDADRRKIIHVALTQGRGGIECLGFLRGVLKRCTNIPFFHVDRGCWYPWALRTVRAPYEITKGGIRNLVETWNGILKNRLQDFH